MMLKRIHRVVLIVIALAVGRVLISMNKQEAVRINPLFDSREESASSVSSSSSETEAVRPGSAVLWKLVDESRASAAKQDASKLFVLKGSSAIPEQLTLAMASNELFRRLFEVPAGKQFWTSPMGLEMVGSQQEWDQFIERDYPQESWPYMKAKIGSSWGYGAEPALVGKVYDSADDWKKDLVVHVVAHTLLTSLQEQKTPPLWIAEGLAYVFQFYLLGSAQNYCVPSEPMLEDPTWDLAPPEKWREMLKTSVEQDKSPELRQMVKAQLDSMSSAERIKVFSIMEYLLAERRKDLLALLAQLRTDHPHDEAMESIFGFEKLDKDWKAFVLKNY